MPVVAAIAPFVPAIATVAAAGIGAFASMNAAHTQATAGANALDLTRSQYEIARGDLAPYRKVGESALGDISSLYGYANPVTGAPGTGVQDFSKFTNSPDYKFAVDQGQLALDRGAAAKGQLLGGGHTKDTLAFAEGLASQQYGNYFNRLMAIAGMGQNSAAGSANLAAGFGTAGSAAINGIGAANASGPVGVANALSTVPQNLLYAQLLGGSTNSNPSSYVAPGVTPNYGTGSMAAGNAWQPYGVLPQG